MPTWKRSPEAKRRRVRALSIHDRIIPDIIPAGLSRPKTLPELMNWKNASSEKLPDMKPAKLTKVLLNVIIEGSFGPLHVVMSPEDTVGDLISAVIHMYVKELRRPILSTDDPRGFDLHYSQFSFECLERDEKLMVLGSRNFYLCSKKKVVLGARAGSSRSCSNQAKRVAAPNNFSWLKLLDSLL